jgi:hypothetical protein
MAMGTVSKDQRKKTKKFKQKHTKEKISRNGGNVYADVDSIEIKKKKII